jgi:cyclopropane fatty-acyl-phospholipid synthase-like methyltransferase
VQANFVGSSNEDALTEGFKFYQRVKKTARLLGNEVGKNESKFLDFGCGWGRCSRIFRKDYRSNNMFGVDIDPCI